MGGPCRKCCAGQAPPGTLPYQWKRYAQESPSHFKVSVHPLAAHASSLCCLHPGFFSIGSVFPGLPSSPCFQQSWVSFAAVLGAACPSCCCPALASLIFCLSAQPLQPQPGNPQILHSIWLYFWTSTQWHAASNLALAAAASHTNGL